MKLENDFLRRTYEGALSKAFPDSFSALKIKMKAFERGSQGQVREVLRSVRKFVDTKVPSEKGHINLLGRYKALDISVTPEGVIIGISYHGAGEEPGIQKDYGMLFNSEISEIFIPQDQIVLSEVAKELGVGAFDIMCHLHFPEMTRKDYWQQQPNTKEKGQVQEYRAMALDLFQKEKAEEVNLDDSLDRDFSIRFPKLVEYLKDCSSLFYCEKKGISLSQEVVQTTGGLVQDVLTT